MPSLEGFTSLRNGHIDFETRRCICLVFSAMIFWPLCLSFLHCLAETGSVTPLLLCSTLPILSFVSMPPPMLVWGGALSSVSLVLCSQIPRPSFFFCATCGSCVSCCRRLVWTIVFSFSRPLPWQQCGRAVESVVRTCDGSDETM